MVSTNHIFSGFAFVGFILVSILLPLHIKAKNIGTCAFIIWTGILCFNGFVNSIIWNNNVTNWAPVWCDISSRLMTGGTVAIPSACLCIARHLYHVTSSIIANRRAQGECRTWQSVLSDYSLVLGIPALFIIFSYIVQLNRFYIFEEIGCFYATDTTALFYPLGVMWPVVIALITAIYAGATVCTLIKRRSRFKELMQRDEHFRRLLALVIMVFICSFPPSLWLIASDVANNPVTPWLGWDFEHANISQIVQITSTTWQASGSQSVAGLQFTRWAYVMYAAIFFAFFGFTAGARNHYRLALGLLANRCDSLVACDTQETRVGCSASRRVTALSSSTTQIPGCPYLPPYLSAISLDDIHHTSHHSCSHESTEQEAKPNLELEPDQITYSTNKDGRAEYMSTALSIPMQPAPVLDIMSVLRRHSADVGTGHDK